MALILVVLPSSDDRSQLLCALKVSGHEAIAVQTWDDVPALAGISALDATVFETDERQKIESVTLQLALANLGSLHPDLIAVRLNGCGAHPTTLRPLHSWAPGWPATVRRVVTLLTNALHLRSTRRQLNQLHSRALVGDQEALNEFCHCVYLEVRKQLLARSPHEDPHLIEMAVDDALFKHATHRARYDTSRGHPIAFIKKIALDSLADLRRSRLRRLSHEVTAGLDFPAAVARTESTLRARETERYLSARVRILMSVACSDRERMFVRAWLQGASTGRLAAILELPASDTTPADIRVHAVKERLRKRARLAIQDDRSNPAL